MVVLCRVLTGPRARRPANAATVTLVRALPQFMTLEPSGSSAIVISGLEPRILQIAAPPLVF